MLNENYKNDIAENEAAGNPEASEGRKITENIWLCPDGVYRWSYEMDMLHNPVILFTIWKALGLSFGIVYIFVLILDIAGNNLNTQADLWNALKFFLILTAVLFVLSVISYLILTAVYGRKYQVLFEMTEDQVTHIQMPGQFKKTEAIGWLTALAGRMTGNPSMIGIGLNTAARDTKTSVFSSVKTIKVRRKLHTIHVNQLLDRNQIYAEDADFDFVEEFILGHCINAKKK